jgi:hypothetical protein
MDPDVALQEIRTAMGDWLDAEDDALDVNSIAAGDRLVSNFQALDDWLSKGGFLPAGWEKKAGRHRK